MGELARAYDWSKTSLGTPDKWPQSLRTTLSILLNSKFPMFLFWGEDLLCFYNDAYRPSLGNEGKHPGALGKKGGDVWPEIWAFIKPLIDQVLAGGEATWNEDQLLPIYRNKKLEDVYWTFSYSPVSDESGRPAGVFVTCTETTKAVQSLRLLRESEQRFQNLVRDATVGVIVLTGEEMIVEIVNNAYGRLVGRQSTELINRRLFDVIPEAIDSFYPLLNQVRISGESIHLYEHPYFVYVQGERKEGYLNIVYQPYREEDGHIAGVMALCQDVTETVLAKKKLVESESRFRTLVEHAPVPIGMTRDRDMVFEAINAPMMELIGSSEDVLGRPLLDVLPELEGQPVMDMLFNVWDTAKIHKDYELPAALRVDGKLVQRYYNTSYTPVLENGAMTGIIHLSIDVTEQVEARHKLEESRKDLQLAIEIAELGTFLIDLATGKGTYSDRVKEWFGLTGNSNDMSHILSAVHPDDQQYVQQGIQHATGSKAHSQHDLVYRMYTPGTGRLRYLRSIGKTFFNGEGKAYEIRGIIQDVTQQIEHQRRIEESEAELQRRIEERTRELQYSNEELQQFAHVASHDLKEPVRKIRTFGNRLKAEFGDGLPERAKLYLEKMEGAAARMYAMIDGVLLYSSLNVLKQAAEPVNLNTVVQQIEDDLEVLVQQKNAVIERGELPVIEGSPVLLYQLFYNLVNNSLKFTKEGEAPRIRIRSERLAPDAREPYALISVEDNGIGFDQEQAANIFETFVRLNTKDKYEGTGLGLALCQKIVERHGGSIKAEGTEGAGAVFSIELPLKQAIS